MSALEGCISELMEDLARSEQRRFDAEAKRDERMEINVRYSEENARLRSEIADLREKLLQAQRDLEASKAETKQRENAEPVSYWE